MLINEGANVNAKINSPSQISVMCKKVLRSLAKLVSEQTKEVDDKQGPTALQFAAVVPNNEVIVEVLVSNGADINAKSSRQSTPLHLAVQAQLLKTAEILLKNGANVNVQDEEGKSILYAAIESRNPPLVDLILNFHPIVGNKREKVLFRSFLNDIDCDAIKISKALLQYGFVSNPEDRENIELLHFAIEKGTLEIVEEMLKCSSNHEKFMNALSKEGFHSFACCS